MDRAASIASSHAFEHGMGTCAVGRKCRMPHERTEVVIHYLSLLRIAISICNKSRRNLQAVFEYTYAGFKAIFKPPFAR